jgi:hypothetical protein
MGQAENPFKIIRIIKHFDFSDNRFSRHQLFRKSRFSEKRVPEKRNQTCPNSAVVHPGEKLWNQIKSLVPPVRALFLTTCHCLTAATLSVRSCPFACCGLRHLNRQCWTLPFPPESARHPHLLPVPAPISPSATSPQQYAPPLASCRRASMSPGLLPSSGWSLHLHSDYSRRTSSALRPFRHRALRVQLRHASIPDKSTTQPVIRLPGFFVSPAQNHKELRTSWASSFLPFFMLDAYGFTFLAVRAFIGETAAAFDWVCLFRQSLIYLIAPVEMRWNWLLLGNGETGCIILEKYK